MFSEQDLIRRLQEKTGILFDVESVTSTSFLARPSGFNPDTPGFSVLIERRNFRLHASVVLDAFSGQLHSAIRAGVTNNPESVAAVERALESLSWIPEIHVGDDAISLVATDSEEFLRDAELLIDRSVDVIRTLTEFVLSNYVITKPIEFRAARPRGQSGVTGEHSVWEYDPSERDKSTTVHRVLENWLIEQLREHDIEPLDSVKGPMFDVGWQIADQIVVCEVKSTRLNETKQVRLGLGQVLHYRYETSVLTDSAVIAALLVEVEPKDPNLVDLCQQLGVQIFWPSKGIPPALLKGDTGS